MWYRYKLIRSGLLAQEWHLVDVRQVPKETATQTRWRAPATLIFGAIFKYIGNSQKKVCIVPAHGTDLHKSIQKSSSYLSKYQKLSPYADLCLCVFRNFLKLLWLNQPVIKFSEIPWRVVVQHRAVGTHGDVLSVNCEGGLTPLWNWLPSAVSAIIYFLLFF